MSIDDKVKELQETYDRWQKVKTRDDVRLLEIVGKVVDNPVEYVAQLSEEQINLVLTLSEEPAHIMVCQARPKQFGLWAELYSIMGLQQLGIMLRHEPQKTLDAFENMSQGMQAELLSSLRIFPILQWAPLANVTGVELRCFGENRNPDYKRFQIAYFDEKGDHYIPSVESEPYFAELLGLLSGMDDTKYLLSVKGLVRMQSPKLDWSVKKLKENDLFFAVYGCMPRRADDLLEIDDYDRELCEHVESFGFDGELWYRWYRELNDLDNYHMASHEDILLVDEAWKLVEKKVTDEEKEEFNRGYNQSLADGHVGRWAQNIIDNVKKDTVGGGNYRVMFERRAA